MADEVKPTTTPAPAPAPAFDPQALEAMVQGAVKTSIESLVKEGAAKQKELEEAKAAEGQKPAQPGPFDEMFKPALDPVIKSVREAEARAAMAADSVDFYTNPENATAFKYRSRIEETVTAQARRGNLISRKDAWHWLRGGELHDELNKEGLTAHEVKLQAAREASAAGPSTTVPKFTKPIAEMKTDELGEALKGVTF